jgi:complex iron-sulfur molybdoenzyme family reductase subunit gamma
MEKAETQNVAAEGKRQFDRWAVVFKRHLASEEKFNVNFREGGVTPVAFAVWNGSEGDRGGRKVVSTWYYVGLETEEKKATYAYPVFAFIGAAGIETLIILGLRKRRKT